MIRGAFTDPKDSFMYPRVIRRHENTNNADVTSSTTATGSMDEGETDPTAYLAGRQSNRIKKSDKHSPQKSN